MLIFNLKARFSLRLQLIAPLVDEVFDFDLMPARITEGFVGVLVTSCRTGQWICENEW